LIIGNGWVLWCVQLFLSSTSILKKKRISNSLTFSTPSVFLSVISYTPLLSSSPTLFTFCPSTSMDPNSLSDFALVIADVLSEVLHQTRDYHQRCGGPAPPPQKSIFGSMARDRKSPFDGCHLPMISLDKYIQRLAHYTFTPSSCFLVALVYMDRIISSHPDNFALTEFNVHRLFMACLVIATKFWSDWFYDNEYYAKIGGVTSSELSGLEMNVLLWLDFHLLIDSESFGAEYSKLSSGCLKPLVLPTLLGRFSECPCCCIGPHQALSPIDCILDALVLEVHTISSRIPPDTSSSFSSSGPGCPYLFSSIPPACMRQPGSPNCICTLNRQLLPTSAPVV